MTASTSTIETAPPLRAYLVLAMGLAAVALAAIFIRLSLAEGVPPLVIAASRLVLATLMLTPITLRRYGAELRGLSRHEVGLLILSGVFLAIHFAAWVSSLQYTTVLISGVLVNTTPIWAGILEVFVLKTRLTRGIFFGLIIALIGSLIIAVPMNETAAHFDDTAILGGVLAFTGAVTVAIYMTIGRSLRTRLSLLPYIWSVYGTAAIALSIVVALQGLPIIGYAPSAYLWMLLMAIFPQLIGHSSFNYILAYFPATYIGIATQLEPIGSAVVAFFLFAEIPGWTQVIGSAIIMIGVVLATLQQGKKSG